MRFLAYVARVSAVIVVLGGLHSPCSAGTTTIDFEAPDVTGFQAMDPYVESGVTFRTGTLVPGWYCGVVGLWDHGGNQVLGTSSNGLDAGGRYDIVAELPLEQSINFVAVDIIRLNDAEGCNDRCYYYARLTLVGAASTVLAYAELGCPSARRTLGATASEPVTSAIVEIIFFGCSCGADFDPCTLCGSKPFAIDNFTFDNVPASSPIALTPSVLWPPNHQLIDVHAAVGPTDGCGEAKLVSATSTEPDAGTSLEDLPGDIQSVEIGTADFDFVLRSERAEEGDGRIYTVCYDIQCGAGETTRHCATVDVPHDRRGQATLAGSEAQ